MALAVSCSLVSTYMHVYILLYFCTSTFSMCAFPSAHFTMSAIFSMRLFSHKISRDFSQITITKVNGDKPQGVFKHVKSRFRDGLFPGTRPYPTNDTDTLKPNRAKNNPQSIFYRRNTKLLFAARLSVKGSKRHALSPYLCSSPDTRKQYFSGVVLKAPPQILSGWFCVVSCASGEGKLPQPTYYTYLYIASCPLNNVWTYTCTT